MQCNKKKRSVCFNPISSELQHGPKTVVVAAKPRQLMAGGGAGAGGLRALCCRVPLCPAGGCCQVIA